MEQNSFTKLVCAQAAFTVAAKWCRFSSLNASFFKSCGWITLRFWKVSLQIVVKAWNTKNIWLVITFLYTWRYPNTPYARARFVTPTHWFNFSTNEISSVAIACTRGRKNFLPARHNFLVSIISALMNVRNSRVSWRKFRDNWACVRVCDA